MKLKLLNRNWYSRGDTGPDLELQILNQDGTPYSIPSGAQVFTVVSDLTGTLSFSRSSTVVSASEGKVSMPVGDMTWWYPIGEYLVKCTVVLTSGDVLSTEPQSLLLRPHQYQVAIDEDSSWGPLGSTPSGVLSRPSYGPWDKSLVIDVADQSSNTQWGWVASVIVPEENRGTVVTFQFWRYLERVQATKSASFEAFSTTSDSSTEGRTNLWSLTFSNTGLVAFHSNRVTLPDDAFKIWVELKLQAGGKVYFFEPSVVFGPNSVPLS